ncbi:SRPBCC family protein [Caulobacter sp.]|uniref:SRPBCC family protein n=1 Tax=Caulobacter sp. TaxID=78 RepID=UPI001B2F77C6|nr:SRPBCC family protein [Caulobacter sp.]MBO9544497.1 SRPBCC family protein [Caulobacter sp.]
MTKLIVTQSGDRDLIVTRVFNAPRALVFKALAEPALVQRWMLGPPGWTMPVCEIDLRPGGKFRYVWRNTAGVDMGMGGTYLEVEPPARTVHEEIFEEDWTGGRTRITTLLAEVGGITTMTMTIEYASPEGRAQALATPMLDGMESGYSTLDTLLEAMSQPA